MIRMGFKRYRFKTHVKSMQTMPLTLKTHANSSNYCVTTANATAAAPTAATVSAIALQPLRSFISSAIALLLLGELVRLVRPPATGRSASFRLRFRFVRAVRAVRGEAKLCGRM